MRYAILPAEHLTAISINLVVIASTVFSAFQLLPIIFQNNAKVHLIESQLKSSQQDINLLNSALDSQDSHLIARKNANLVPNSNLSIRWLK